MLPLELPDAALWWVEHECYELLALQDRGKKPRSNREVRAVGWPDSEPPGDGRGGFHLATRDPEVIRRLWGHWPRANIGCAVPPGQVILDLDSPEALELLAGLGFALPTTATVLTHRGRHLHYSLPDGVKLRQVDLGRALKAAHARGESWGLEEIPPAARAVELRTAGAGYGILPPSVHPSGTVYRLEGDRWPGITPAPGWLVQLFDKAHFTGTAPAGAGMGHPPAGCELPERIAAGSRDVILFRYACRLRALGLGFEEAKALMRLAWKRAEQPPGDPYPWEAALRKLEQAWKYPAGRSPGFGGGTSRQNDTFVKSGSSVLKEGDITSTSTPDVPGGAEAFGELLPLTAPVDLPHFPVEALPAVIGDYVSQVAEVVQTPVDLPAFLALGVLAAAGSYARLWVKVGHLSAAPVCLYLAPVMPSSERKSSAYRHLVAPLEDFETALRRQRAPEILAARELRGADEAHIRRLRRQAGEATDPEERRALTRQAAELQGDLPEPPAEPCLLVGDITQEGLATKLQEHGGRLAVFDTEGSIFSIALGRYSSGSPNFEVLLRGWSADSLRIDRKGSGAIRVDSPVLTVCVPIQPDILRQLGEKRETVALGLMSRFLYALPESRAGYRPFPQQALPAGARLAYEAAVGRLLHLSASPLASPEVSPWRLLELAGEGLERWIAFYDTVEASMRPGGRLADIADWGGKLPGNVARLAALFHAVEAGSEPWAKPISPGAVERAAQIGEALQEHALAAYQLLGADPVTALALRAWQIIARHRWQRFTRRELYRALGEPPKTVDPAVEVLQDRGYLRRLPSPSRGATGRPPSPSYQVRPGLLSTSTP